MNADSSQWAELYSRLLSAETHDEVSLIDEKLGVFTKFSTDEDAK